MIIIYLIQARQVALTALLVAHKPNQADSKQTETLTMIIECKMSNNNGQLSQTSKRCPQPNRYTRINISPYLPFKIYRPSDIVISVEEI